VQTFCYNRFVYCFGSCIVLKSPLFCYRRKKLIHVVQSEGNGSLWKKMTIIGDGHVGIRARQDTSRHDTSCRAKWNLSFGCDPFHMQSTLPSKYCGRGLLLSLDVTKHHVWSAGAIDFIFYYRCTVWWECVNYAPNRYLCCKRLYRVAQK